MSSSEVIVAIFDNVGVVRGWAESTCRESVSAHDIHRTETTGAKKKKKIMLFQLFLSRTISRERERCY